MVAIPIACYYINSLLVNQIDGLEQDCGISSALAMKISQSSSKP